MAQGQAPVPREGSRQTESEMSICGFHRRDLAGEFDQGLRAMTVISLPLFLEAKARQAACECVLLTPSRSSKLSNKKATVNPTAPAFRILVTKRPCSSSGIRPGRTGAHPSKAPTTLRYGRSAALWTKMPQPTSPSGARFIASMARTGSRCTASWLRKAELSPLRAGRIAQSSRQGRLTSDRIKPSSICPAFS